MKAMKAEPKLPALRQEPATPAASREIYDYAALADAPNTQRSYVSDWKHFVSWCQVRRFSPLPCNPDQLAQYVRYCVEKLGLKTSTVGRRLAAINQAHVRNGHASPAGEWVVKKTMQRIRREHGRPARGKDPILTKDLRTMIAALPQDLAGARDKAILLLGFAGGMRRSEIVALDIGDLELGEEGFAVQILRSKTDQTGAGRKIGIPYGQDPLTCPVKAVLAWIEVAQLTSGPLFRGVNRWNRPLPTRLSDKVIWRVVKKWAATIGKNPASFGAHSLRAGLITQATIGGATEQSIQEQTGHKSVAVLRRYVREASLFRNNAAKKTGL
jgi:integrase